jgi:hypothetical protein
VKVRPRTVDKGDLRKRFTAERETPPPGTPDAEFTRLASELADNVGNTIKVATELGLKFLETLARMSPVGGGTGVSATTADVLGNARKNVPEFSGQTASMLTNLVVNRGFAALRTVQQAVQNPRRQG